MTTPDNNLSNDKLITLYKELDDLPPKCQDKQLEAVRVLEPVIRKMISNQYSLTDICKRINPELDLKITGTTLTKYLDNIETERKKALLAAKLEATRVKREATRLAKLSQPVEPISQSAIAPQSSGNDKVSESTQLSEAVTVPEAELVPEAIAPTTSNTSSVITKSVVPKSVKSSDTKAIVTDVSVETKPIDSDSEAEVLKKEKAEAKRLRDERMDKHFNKY